MDFEHAFMQSNFFMIFQMMFMASLLVPSIIGRVDLYGKVLRTLASNVVVLDQLPCSYMFSIRYRI